MNTTRLTHRFEAALIYANHLHVNQVRKINAVPYMSHLLSVAALVLEDGGTEDEAIAALLHDAVEDQGGQPTREAIRQQFGEAVVAIVDGCTEWSQPPKPPWKQRKQAYLENLRHASSSVRRVSLADKLHNARSLLAAWQQQGDCIWDQFNSASAERLWFYRELSQIYREHGSCWLSCEFDRVVDLLSELDSKQTEHDSIKQSET